jgi:hypothetical protein
MAQRPLSLTDSELDIVWAAARPLDVSRRDGFLQDVAEALSRLPQRGDGAVFRVVAEVQRRHFDPPLGLEGRPMAQYKMAKSA